MKNYTKTAALVAVSCIAMFGFSGCVTKAEIRAQKQAAEKQEQLLLRVWADGTDEDEKWGAWNSLQFTRGRVSAFKELSE
jgi:hypothetical protein